MERVYRQSREMPAHFGNPGAYREGVTFECFLRTLIMVATLVSRGISGNVIGKKDNVLTVSTKVPDQSR
jgi:hypothetical protein